MKDREAKENKLKEKDKSKSQESAILKKRQKEKLTPEEMQTRKKYKRDLLLSLINALVIEIYFVALSAINEFAKTQFDLCVKIFYIAYILIAVIMFEIAYKKDKKNLAVNGIEFVLLALHTLLIGRSITLFNETKELFIISTSYVWPVYYCLKAVIIYTKENKRRLKQISDIHEIVKEEKPTKKVAKKRKS